MKLPFVGLLLTLLLALSGSLPAMANPALLATGIYGPASLIYQLPDPIEIQIRKATVVISSTETPQNSGDGPRSTQCSGVLVRNDAILTGAHCIFRIRDGVQISHTVNFFNPARPTEIIDSISGVSVSRNAIVDSTTNVHAVYLNETVIVRLARPKPSAFEPLPIAFVDKLFAAKHKIKKFILAGYGVTQRGFHEQGTTSNELRISYARPAFGLERIPFSITFPVGAYPHAPKRDFPTAINLSRVPMLKLIQHQSTGMVRPGDSGGPLYFEDQGQIFVAGTLVGLSEMANWSYQHGASILKQYVVPTDFSQRSNFCFLASQLGGLPSVRRSCGLE